MELEVTIQVNGQSRPFRECTIADLLRDLGRDATQAGIAVAVCGEVVPRAEWGRRVLRPGDSVELVGATQGG